MPGLLIIGAGGQGKVVANIASLLGHWDRIAFLDDKFPTLKAVHEWPVIGKISAAEGFLGEFEEAIIAFGDNTFRLELLKRLMGHGFKLPVLVHPDASVSRYTTLGPGSVVCAQAALIIDSRIGMGSIINTGASVGHDCVLGDGVHVAPGVRLAGGVTVGDCSWIGIGAVVKEQVTIGRNAVVGAGTVVIRDIPEYVTVVGTPARIIKGDAHAGEDLPARGKSGPSKIEAGAAGPSLDAPNFVGFLEPDDPRWMEVLRKVPHDLFHLPAYLKACADHEGGRPVMFVYDAGDHGLAVPLIKRSLETFGESFAGHFDLASPYGYPGPVNWGDTRQDRLAEAFANLETFLAQEKVVSLFLRLNPFLGVPDTILSQFGDVRAHGPTVYIDLRDEELSWMGIDKKNRKFISGQLADGCVVRRDEWDTVDVVIEAYYETMRRLNALPFYFFPRAFFERLMLEASDHFHLGTAYTPDGEIMGGVFFSEVNGLIQYFLTGTFTKFQALSANKLLINDLRLWGLERGHHTLHLGGGVGCAQDSLAFFKQGFSRLRARFCTFRQVLLPRVYHELAGAREAPGEDFFPAYRRP